MANTIKSVSSRAGKRRPVVVAVSGGFDPIHVGHIRLFEEAKKLGDVLVVIVNNDHWLRKKKRHVFMPDYERCEVIAALRAVDKVVLSKHPKNPRDMSVCRELRELQPDIFSNGGDRTHDNIPEVPVCDAIGCKMLFNVGHGGKVQSSSWLLKDYVKKAARKLLQ